MRIYGEASKVMVDVAGSLGADVSATVTDQSHIGLKLVDASHVAMAHLTVEAVDPVAFDADTNLLRKAMSPEGIDATVDGGRLRVRNGRMTSRIPLLSPAGDVKVPQIQPDATATLPVDEVLACLKQADARFGEVTEVVVDPDAGLTVSLRDGMDTGRGVRIDYLPEELDDISCTMRQSVLLPTDMVAGFLRCMPKGATITLGVTTDYPVVIEAQGDGWSVRWLCAPRIESE